MTKKPTATRAQIANARTEQEIMALGYSIGFALKLIAARLTKKRG